MFSFEVMSILRISELQKIFGDYVSGYNFPTSPQQLYEPVSYILGLGGKRIRPVLAMASYNLYLDEVSAALSAAMAIEVFHNFSLLHDDIMDKADLRRGELPVHLKYDENTAILSGDVMLIQAYTFLEAYETDYLSLIKLFSRTAIEVCEGQRMDMDFELISEVSITDYLRMIELKTSVLLGCAMQMGGILANTSPADQRHLYEFGRNMGIAFQIQDDLLDTFGEVAKVGKKIGGDIQQRKKTYLYLKALELLSASQSARLREIFSSKTELIAEEVTEVIDLFRTAHVKVHAEELMLVYHQLAISHLDAVAVPKERKQVLEQFTATLIQRDN